MSASHMESFGFSFSSLACLSFRFGGAGLSVAAYSKVQHSQHPYEATNPHPCVS